jgi:WD40 repeat protein
MSHCLNPACQKPTNPDDANFCQNCGSMLLLGDRFRPLQLIGQGGFGRTFLAVDVASEKNQRVVIKQFFPTPQSQSPGAAALFRQEAERLTVLGEHPQIPRLLAQYEQDGNLYLVQQYVRGQNLEQVLCQQGPFTETQIWQLLESLLPVLEFIHGQRVIHRDIKPENIILRSPPQPLEHLEHSPSGHPTPLTNLFLVDFGASKFIAEAAPRITGTVIGSAGYAAPEQLMGQATYASDLYSLGVTCIHLLTGLHPFELYSTSQDTWSWHQLVETPVSDRLRRILDKLLQRSVSQRYRSATEALKAVYTQAGVGRPRQPTKPLPVKATPPTQSSLVRSSPGHLATAPLPAWECLNVLEGHSGSVTAVALSPDSSLIASGSTDKTIKLWDLETGKLIHTFPGRSLLVRDGHTDRISALLFAPDGRTLISGSDDCTIRFWDMAALRQVHSITGHGWVISALAASQHENMLASGGGEGLISLWDLETTEAIIDLGKHRDRITALLISPDGNTLVSGSTDKTVKLWDLRTDRLITTLRSFSEPVTALAISPDWRTLISASGLSSELARSTNCLLKFWDLNRGTQNASLIAHTDQITGLAITPDGRLLASASEDNRIKLWPLKPNDHGSVIPAGKFATLLHPWAVTCLTFSQDDHTLVSGSADETLRIWRSRP